MLLALWLNLWWGKLFSTKRLFWYAFYELLITFYPVFIGPESDHWLCLSLTHSLTDCCLVNLIDVTLACEDDNSKLVEVVTVAQVDNEKRVDNSLVQIWKVIWS